MNTNELIIKNEFPTINYGIWVDGSFTWLNLCETNNVYKNKTEDLLIKIDSNYVCKEAVLKTFKIINLTNRKRNIKLFFRHSFSNRGLDQVTFYAPNVQAIIRSVKKEYILMNGMMDGRGIIQYCTNYQECNSLNNGLITFQPFSTGDAISLFSLEGEIDASAELNANYWLCKARDEIEVIKSNALIQLNYLAIANEEVNC